MGWSELLIIGVIALIVLGPERLPRAAISIGRWVGKAKSAMTQLSHQVNRELELDEMKKRIAEHEQLIKEQAEGTELAKLRDEAEETIKQAKKTLNSVAERK